MPETEPNRFCVICGNQTQNGNNYCSGECTFKMCAAVEKEKRDKEKKSREPMICAECGVTFTGRKRKFCSRACLQENKNNRRVQQKRERAIKKYGLKKCKNCGQGLRTAGYGWWKSEHCSDECRKATRDYRSERYKAGKLPIMQAHVMEWKRLGLDKMQHGKHDAHVTAWKKWRLALSPADAARYYKRIGKPWLNRHLSEKARYAIRYRLDLEYRLREINRGTWRKEELKKRDDGTQNFWVLLRERKSCPYCGQKITKENAVADHMDPIKHGGANGQHNLTICCRSCNTKKSGRPFAEWLDMLPAERKRPALLWYKRKHGHPPQQASFCFTFAA